MITLIVGSTGAGKTSYAKKLAEKQSAIIYSIDHWMRSLYWQDMPKNPDMTWFKNNQKWYTDRILRCEHMIQKLSTEQAKQQQASILDLGFSTSSHRKKWIEHYHQCGFLVEIHYLDVDASTRWSRVQQRNQDQGETFVMHVDRLMFDYMEGIFEPPNNKEKNLLTIPYKAL